MLREIFNNLELPCDKFEHDFDLYERGLYERHFQEKGERLPFQLVIH